MVLIYVILHIDLLSVFKPMNFMVMERATAAYFHDSNFCSKNQ